MNNDIPNNELNNRNNLNPVIWGPKAWFFLDSVVLSYPNNPTNTQKEKFASFLYSVADVLPCQKCSHNYMDHLKLNPLKDDDLLNRDKLLEWWIKMHNLVNMSLNKEMMSKKSYMDYYNRMYDEGWCNRSMVRNVIYMCIIILIVIWFREILFRVE